MRVPRLQLVQDPAADALLDDNPFALLVGMLLDQQVPMEKAFTGPYVLAERLSVERLDAEALAGADPEACARAAAVLAPVAAAAEPTGRPLGAANAALELPGDPLGRLWQLATALREYRGDGHVAALVAEGITGLQAHLLQSASGHMPQEVLRRARIGWTDEDWAGAADALRDRGLLSAGPGLALTPAGRAVLDTVEARTDERAWDGGLAALGEHGAEEVLALLRPSVRAVTGSGMLPAISPTGLASSEYS